MRADARFVLFPQFLERKFNDMSEEIEIKDEEDLHRRYDLMKHSAE